MEISVEGQRLLNQILFLLGTRRKRKKGGVPGSKTKSGMRGQGKSGFDEEGNKGSWGL